MKFCLYLYCYCMVLLNFTKNQHDSYVIGIAVIPQNPQICRLIEPEIKYPRNIICV